MIQSKEKHFIAKAVDILKRTLASKGIVIIGHDKDIADAALKVGKLYHDMEKEDDFEI